jgi:WD40 repeat protein/serine/threonine protein kinase
MDSEEPQSDTRTLPLLASELPDDAGASHKPAGTNEQLAKVVLSHLTHISVCAADNPDNASLDAVGPSPPSSCTLDEKYAFVLGRIIGQGGMGEVREARQTSLDRTVAVKQPKLRSQSPGKTAADLELFAREAAITARLEHPHIIPVHDLGLGPDGTPLLAMKLVRGTPWSDMLKADRELSIRDRLAHHLPILIDVAQAVAFAHARGILHRDLKPAQVMVGRHGEVYLMDWGIACSFEQPGGSSSESTALAAMDVKTAPNPAGTSAYMAPEQTEKSGARLGPWTDVWLLGATLYEILTRRPPYPFPRSADAFLAAAQGFVEPPAERIARRNTGESADIPPEISQLCMECLQPEIGKRVPSADVFIQRLRDYQTGATRRDESRKLTDEANQALTQIGPGDDYDLLENCDRTLSRAIALDPENSDALVAKQKVLGLLVEEALEGGDLHLARVQAGRILDQQRRASFLKEIGARERRARQIRSQRIAALAACVVLIATVAALALISRQHIAHALGRAEKSESAALAAKNELSASREAAIYDLYVSNVRLAQREIDDQHFARAEAALLAAPVKYRGWEWGWLMSAAHPERMTFSGHAGSVQSIAFSPDGKHLATAGHDGTTRLWDLQTGQQIGKIEEQTGGAQRVVWSPDGARLLVAGGANSATLYDSKDGKRLQSFSHSAAVQDVHFAFNSPQVATLGADAHLRFFDMVTATVTRDVDLHADRAFAFDLSRDGHFAAVGAGPNGAILLNLDSGTTTPLAPEAAECSAIRFSPDGTKVAVAANGARSYICSVPSGQPLLNFTDSDAVIQEDQRAYGWAADIRWDGNDSVIAGMRARPGSQAFQWSTPDLAAKKFAQVEPAGLPPGGDVTSIDLSPDHQLLAVASESGRVCLYDAGASAAAKTLFDTERGIHGLRWTPDGKRIVAGSFSQRHYTFKANDGTTEVEASLPDRSHCTAVDATGERVAFSARHFGFLVQTVSTGKELLRIALPAGADDASWVAFSPDGSTLLTVCSSFPQPHAPRADLWSLQDGHLLHRVTGETDKPNIAIYSSDGNHIYIGGSDGSFMVANSSDGKPGTKLTPLAGRVNALSLSHDGKRIAAAGVGGEGAILDADTGKLLFRLAERSAEITDICFSPDGTRLATSSYDATIGIWDSQTGRQLCSLKGHSARAWQAQWSPDGQRLASSSSGFPGVKIWEPMPVSSQTGLAGWTSELRQWQAARFEAKISRK